MRIVQARRLIWLSFIFLVVLGGLGGKLYIVQVLRSEAYAREAHSQRILDLVPNDRGAILDRAGKPLTDPQPGWGVAVFPPLVKDPAGEARALAALLDLSEVQEQDLARRLKQGAQPQWVIPQVSAEAAEQVRRLRLPGVVSSPVVTRYGPDALAQHLVGYVNLKVGQYGLERLYEKQLQGDAVPKMAAYQDARGDLIAGLGIRVVLPQTGKQPYNLHTTLDREIQAAVERVLDRRGHPAGGAWRGAVVVMEPKSGAILAMASRPGFDQARDLARPDPLGEAFLMNRAVNLFEPGSVFKAVVAAAALDKGLVHLDERFYCPGHYTVGGQRFTDANGGAHGWLTFREAIAKSCNVVFAQVGYERLGREELLAAARRFGFGETALGLQEEEAGVLPALKYGGDVAQISFGQGLLVTPLQVARAFSAIANGGMLPPVKLVTAIKNPAGRVMDYPAAGKPVRVISAAAAAELRKALVGVTDPRGSGTGRRAWVEGVGSAGKTGSAEGAENGQKAVHAWFAGYLPATAPRYVIAVMVQGGGAGGEVAAPVFKEIGEAIVQLK